MFLKGKKKYISLSAILFIILYIFITPIPMGQDVYFMPEWAVFAQAAALEIPAEKDTLKRTGEDKNDITGTELKSFVLGGIFGYFSEGGKVINSRTIENQIGISSFGWVQYSEKDFSSEIYSPKNKLITKIDAPGFVHIDSNRFYLFEPGGSGVSKYDAGGKQEWRYIHTAPITAFNSSAGGTIIGYSDGRLVCIDAQGNKSFEFYPGGSEYQVISGAAISGDGKRVLCISGLEKQRAILVNVVNNHYKIVYHIFLENDLRRQAFAAFEQNGNFAVFESADGIGIIDCKNLTASFIKEAGSIVNIGFENYKNILTVLLENGGTYSLMAVEMPGFKIGKTVFHSKDAFLHQSKDRVYLGAGDKITAFRLGGIK